MRKNKKLLSLAISACMVGSMLAGCSEKSSDDADTPSSSVETEAESTEEAESSEEADDDTDNVSDDVEEESSEESSEEETDEASDTDSDEDTIADEFIEQLMEAKTMDSYTSTTNMGITYVMTEDGEQSYIDGTITFKTLKDENGNASLNIYAEMSYDDGYDAGVYSGDVLTLTLVDDRMYIDISALYQPAVELLIGSDTDTLEEYLEAFGTSSDEIQSLLVLGIPVGDLDLNTADYSQLESVMEMVSSDFMNTIYDTLGEGVLTQNGDTYTITLYDEICVDVLDALMSVLDDNMETIYDAYVDALKNTDNSEYLTSVTTAIVDELIDGLEAVAGEELDEETLSEVETEISDAIDEYQATLEESVTEMEDTKADFLEEFEAALEEYEDIKAEIDELLSTNDDTIRLVSDITFSGDEGSRVVESGTELNLNFTEEYAEDELYDGSEAYAVDYELSMTVSSTVKEGDVSITAPENASTLEDLVRVIYNVYTIYSEYTEDVYDDYDTTVGYEYDDDDYDYSYQYNDYTQAELCEIYGVTLEDGQVIACYTTDGDAVIITPYDGMEFYSPDDTTNMMMEVDENYETYITIYVYDTSYDAEFYEDYYDAEMIEENLYYYEYYEDMADLVYFGDNITIDIELDTYSDEGLDGITGGDTLGFLQGLLKLCEIVSPA